MTNPAPRRARVIQHDEIDGLFGSTDSVQAEAKRIISRAQEVAATLLDAAKAEQAQLEQQLKQISDEELSRFIDAETITRSADAFVDMLEQSARLKAAFLDLTPWLVTLVDACVNRVVGTLEDPDLVARLVEKGVEELRDQSGLTLCVNFEDRPRIQAAMKTHPDRFVGVSDIEISSTYAAGQVRVRSDGGIVDIDLTTQLDRLLENLDKGIFEVKQAKPRL